MMEVIAEQPWSWMLIADGDRLFLSVVCGGVGVYDVDVELSGDEVANYGQSGNEYLNQFARAVSAAPISFEARRLSGLLSGEEASVAIAEWRQRRPAR
jgi:hypothetical protein